MTALARALSRMPITSSVETVRITSSAGRFTSAPSAVPGACAIATGRSIPALWRITRKYPDQPLATAEAATAYSRIRSQPITQATISPSVA
jgi:hypothetical protein